MKSMVLFYAALGILVLGSHTAPYVDVDHQVNPDPTTQTENGPEMMELRVDLEIGADLIHALFNFMDILMDPRSYTNHYEVRFFFIKYSMPTCLLTLSLPHLESESG